MSEASPKPNTHRRVSATQQGEMIKYTASALILLAAVGAYFFLLRFAEKPATQDSDVLITQVSVDTVETYSGVLDLVVPGTVISHREIRMAAEIVGKIQKKYDEFQAGNFVVAGTVLAEIDPTEYEADRDVLLAELEQAKKRLDENAKQIAGEKENIRLAKNDLQIQNRELQRVERLSSALSRSEVDQARRAMNVSRTNLTARENALTLLKASRDRLEAAQEQVRRQLKKAELNLQRVTITAPVDGVIVREMVQADDYVRAGSEIAMFEDTSVAEVRCNLTTAELNWIRKNSAYVSPGELLEVDPRFVAYQVPKTDVKIFEASDPEVVWRGSMERFDGIGRDEATKTIPCRVIIEQPIVDTDSGPRALVRNMFVKCRIEVDASSTADGRNLLQIDEIAVQPGQYVWKVVEGKLEKAPVEIVDRTQIDTAQGSMRVAVVRGVNGSLQANDKVVISPMSQPTDGATVIVSKDEPAAPDVASSSLSRSNE